MMLRPTLAGVATYKGEELPGVHAKWPVIVKLDRWRAVCATLNDPTRRTSPGKQPKHLSGGVTSASAAGR